MHSNRLEPRSPGRDTSWFLQRNGEQLAHQTAITHRIGKRTLAFLLVSDRGAATEPCNSERILGLLTPEKDKLEPDKAFLAK
ncbi:hypothetical protein PtA15_9A81 [Puccinia triticina]|uniref:Uncharacterized protein n=1 Tax=Puccinia triticina TaxID=208348 RepID=A0ABY7CZ16_9BASI|nr:uncharacterized protein PtA15_9A81 [Puccinia triticina]WAQ87957.1 hypothetical protein PtA15_9A81 [Puccinia triticina]WAR60147.1 hypothetical protein PtB15_9B84 [Puccinia triticina]